MKIQIKNIIIILLLGALISSCASNKPKGMRKSRKKNCDCPSFGQLEFDKKQTIAYSEIYG